MKTEADRIGIQFERIPGVNGANVPDWLHTQFLNSPLLPNEIGCTASHLTAHKRIIDDGLPFAIVLEDDVRLEPGLTQAASEAIAAAPAGWDYIHLSATVTRAVYSVARLSNDRHLVRFLRVPLNAGGYLISRQGAEKMLAPRRRARLIDTEHQMASRVRRARRLPLTNHS